MPHQSRLKPTRELKQAFMQTGFVDWHLPSTTAQRTQARQLTQPSEQAQQQPQLQQGLYLAAQHSDHGDDQHDQTDHGDTALQTAPPELKRPLLYVVVLMNDDYTPMDFVIEILQQYFALSLDQATEVMLTVHYEGKGIAGVYPRDIAETKANQVNHYARSQGHPLLCMIEPKE